MQTHRFLTLLLALSILTASEADALEVRLTATRSIVEQGEPILLWVDYWNDSKETIGLVAPLLFDFSVLDLRKNGVRFTEPMEQAKRPPPGTIDQIRQLMPSEHLVFYADLREIFNVLEDGSYSVTVVNENRHPERYLSKKKPSMAAANVYSKPIRSNTLSITVAESSGPAFELIYKQFREGRAGSVNICDASAAILLDYPSSAYAPHALMCQAHRKLGLDGTVPLEERLVQAGELVRRLSAEYSSFEGRNLHRMRFADALLLNGHFGLAREVVGDLRKEGPMNTIERRYLEKLESRVAGRQ